MKPEDIRALREQLQLTQEVFARILGVSFATVNRWENGEEYTERRLRQSPADAGAVD